MAKKKSVSFDAMVKFFMQNYNIPTKKDIERLNDRLDRLEVLLKESVSGAAIIPSTKGSRGRRLDKPGTTASENVYNVIKEAGEQGAGFSEIREKTGYGEKKIRNIVFRLNKLNKIDRKTRGIYTSK